MKLNENTEVTTLIMNNTYCTEGHSLNTTKSNQPNSVSIWTTAVICSAANHYKPDWENTIYSYAVLPHQAECKGISVCAYESVYMFLSTLPTGIKLSNSADLCKYHAGPQRRPGAY